jgi:hypothetical protein
MFTADSVDFKITIAFIFVELMSMALPLKLRQGKKI